MRVVSGEFKGAQLFSPKNEGVRPTSDRVKVCLFDLLMARMSFVGINCLDLFCGSGALGIEALSRGAAHCTFCDVDLSTVKRNLQKVKVADRAQLIAGDYKSSLNKLKGQAYDLIFLDPPYGKGFEFDALSFINSNKLCENGFIFVEQSAKNGLLNFEKYSIIVSRRIASTTVNLLSKEHA